VSALIGTLAVSRETEERLRTLLELVKRWTGRINLVGSSTLPDAWRRHIVDSAQLWPLAPPATLWRDYGSGAGFPGLVIAAIAAEHAPDTRVELVEADQRKAVFLATAVRALGLDVTVHAARAESLALPRAEVISARALAPLSTLLQLAFSQRDPAGIALFPKGETVHKELADAARSWSFVHRLHPSLTDPRSAIIEIGRIDGPHTAPDPRPRQPERRRGEDNHGH
jgi:16S rRNA (guanine527-N7)-methyltransferase